MQNKDFKCYLLFFVIFLFGKLFLQQSQNKVAKNANIKSPKISNKHDFTVKYTEDMNIK